MERLACDMRGVGRTLVRWFRTGDRAVVSGHDYGAPTYRRGYRPGVGDVEEEVLTCGSCRFESVGWHRWYGGPQ